MKNVHVHVHGALDEYLDRSTAHPRVVTSDDEHGIKRDQQGRFSTSSGTGEQHAATAALHESLATRKGTDHPHHAFHMAAAEAHTSAANFLAQANKAQHPGAAVAAEHAAKQARTHENVINKGKGSDPQGEVSRQNKAMSDPRVAKENKERMADLDAKHKAPGKKSKTKDAQDCGCQHADMMGAPIDDDTNLFDYAYASEALKAFNSGEPVPLPKKMTGDVLFFDHSGWLTSDDWAKWNAEHKKHSGAAALHTAAIGHKGLYHSDTPYHSAAAHHHAAAAEAYHGAMHGTPPNKHGIAGKPEEYVAAAKHHAGEAVKEEAKIKPPKQAKVKPKSGAMKSSSSASVRKIGKALLKAQKKAHESDDYHYKSK